MHRNETNARACSAPESPPAQTPLNRTPSQLTLLAKPDAVLRYSLAWAGCKTSAAKSLRGRRSLKRDVFYGVPESGL